MSGRGRMRGGMLRGGRGGRGGHSSQAIPDSVRAPSSTTTMTLHERFSAVPAPRRGGRGRGPGRSPQLLQQLGDGAALQGGRKKQLLAARLQSRLAGRGAQVGARARGRGRGAAGMGVSAAKIQQARRIANQREAASATQQPSRGRGRGLLRYMNRGSRLGGAMSARIGTVATRGRAPGPAARGRGRGAGVARGRGQPVKRGAMAMRGARPTAVAMQGVRRGGATAGLRGRGRGRGVRGARGMGSLARNPRPPASRQDLDQEMDSYMAEGKINVISFD